MLNIRAMEEHSDVVDDADELEVESDRTVVFSSRSRPIKNRDFDPDEIGIVPPGPT